jgi:hypothetical protein
MADAKLTLGFDTEGALASLTAFSRKAKAILSEPLVGPRADVGTAKGLEDAFGNLQRTRTSLDQVRTAAGATLTQLGGVAGAIALFDQLTTAVGAAADEQVRLNTTLKAMDVGTLTASLTQYNNQLDIMVERQRMAEQGGLGGLLSNLSVAFLNTKQALAETLSGSTAEEDAARVRARRLAVIDFEEGQKQRKLLAAGAATEFQSLQFRQADLLARGDLAGAEAGAKAIEEQQAKANALAKEALKADQERRRAAELAVSGATPESVEITFKQELLNLDKELFLSGQRRQQQNQRGIEDLRQLVAETANLREQLERDRTTQEGVADAAEQERQARRRRLELETVGQLREAEQGLAQEIAGAQGRILNDISETNAARREQAVATARAEVEAVQAAATAQLRGLGGRQAAAQSQLETLSGLPSTPEVERRRLTLLSQIQDIQGQITEAARKGAADRAAIEIKTAAELRQLAIKDAADRIALLQKSIAKETELRTEARNLLAEALRGVGTGAGQQAVNEFSLVSRVSLQRDLDQRRRENERVLEEFQAGQAVNQRQLEQALQQQPFQEQLQQFGGLGLATNIAGTTPTQFPGQLTGAEQFRQAQDQIATLSTQVTDALAGIKGSFADSLGQVPALMQDTMDQLLTIVETGKSKLGASLADMVQGQLTRAFADAQRRM